MSNNRDLADLGKSAEAIDVDASAPADSLNIDSSGNVGIGTSSPASSYGFSKTLEVQGVNNAEIEISQTSNNKVWSLGITGNMNYNQTSSGNGYQWDIGGVNRMRLDSSGRLMLGDSTYISNTGGDGKGFHITPENNVYKIRTRASATDTQTHWTLKNPNGDVGTIKTVHSSTQFNTSSDYRLKENVVDMTGAIDRLKLLQPRIFNFIADPDIEVDGFIAHEVSDVVPIAVSGEKDAVKVWEEWETLPEGVSVGDNKTDEDGNTIPDYQGIDQSKLVPLLTGALQEAIAKIEALETTVADLTTRLEALENV